MVCLKRMIAGAVLLLLTALGAYGQSASFAAITGHAQDLNGASVPGATVTATNVETGITRTTQTTSDGLYRFDNLPPGIYDLSIEAHSFATTQVKSVELWVGDDLDINFNLKLAGQTQTVIVTTEAPLNVVVNSLIFDGNTLFTQNITPGSMGNDGVTTGQQVLNAYPNEPSATLLDLFKPVGFYGRVRPISPTLKNPEVNMASLVYQRQLGSSFTYSIGYQGVFAHGLLGETDTNFPTPIADPAHPGYFYMPDVPNPAFGPIRTVFSDRESGYNALVITAVKRMSHHFQFQGSYTWAHTLNNAEDFFGLSEPANPLASLHLENASAQNDVRHLVNFNFVADTNDLLRVPVVRTILNNWTFGMLATLQSGRPYPVSTGDASFTGLNFTDLGSETMQRPNICTAGSAVPGCARAPIGALVATNIGSISGTNLEVGPAGVAACVAAGLANCAALQTTFAAPAGASPSGPVDSFTGTPVDFQYINGNLVRNAG
jgi:hypothetical protein